MNSIRRRLIIYFVIIITLILGLSGAYSYIRISTNLANDLQRSGKSLKSRLETSLPAPLWNFDDYQLDRILDSEMQSSKIAQISIEVNGRLIAGRKNTNNRIERIQALPENTPHEIKFDIFYQDNFQHPIGTVRVQLSNNEMNEQLHRLVLEKLIEIALLDIVILLALTRSLTLLLVRPLQQLHRMLCLAETQTDEEDPKTSLHLPESKYIEFADLTSVYNRIAGRLLNDLRKRKETEEGMRQAKEAAETAYTQLRDAQDSLVQAEKLASLGGLVAGIAHEINTPVGVILTGASVLSEESILFRQHFEAGNIKKSEVQQYCETATQSAALILSNAERAAELIQSFKRVAVDQTSEARRTFELKQYLDEVILSLRPAMKHQLIDIDVFCPEAINIDGYPGAFSQIITNMVTNALHHAFDPYRKDRGNISISAKLERGMVHMCFADNGCGIQPEHLSRIFDPFFTTRRGSGGSGLGLNIVYNLVTQTLGGTIAVNSSPENGTMFNIAFPAIAPAHDNPLHK